jgi:polysaccharide biosynthesis/export protein ExoF
MKRVKMTNSCSGTPSPVVEGLSANRPHVQRLHSWMPALAALLLFSGAGPTISGELTQTRQDTGLAEQTTVSAPAGSSAAPTDLSSAGSSEGYRLDSEDRVRVRFYDRYDRDDLNGEYVINERGQLRLPRIGAFDARGLLTEELEKAIRASVEKDGQKLGFFSIETVLCRPFYITGLVQKPGSYPFVGNFTIVHAVAVAGGLRRPGENAATEALREERSLAEINDRLLEMLVRRERLKAESEGARTISTPREIAIARARGEELIASEQAVLVSEQEVFKRQQSSLTQKISRLKREVERYQSEEIRLGKRIEEQHTIFTQLRKLHDDKIINQQRFLEAVNALDALQRDKQNVLFGLSNAHVELEKAEHELAMLSTNRDARIAQDMGRTEREIARLQMASAKTRQLIANLDTLGAGKSAEAVSYKIMRRDRFGKVTFIPATEVTQIVPGDVIGVDTQSRSLTELASNKRESYERREN